MKRGDSLVVQWLGTFAQVQQAAQCGLKTERKEKGPAGCRDRRVVPTDDSHHGDRQLPGGGAWVRGRWKERG